jgi:hypothetical protein
MKKTIIIALLVLAVLCFFLFSEPWLDLIKRLPDSNKGASWAPFAYYYISRLHAVVGRHERVVEICRLMQETYGDEKSASYIKSENGRYYMPAALFYEATSLEALADGELNDADKLRAKGDSTGHAENADKALEHLYAAQDCLETFTDNYTYDELYSDANKHLNRIRVKLSNLRAGE